MPLVPPTDHRDTFVALKAGVELHDLHRKMAAAIPTVAAIFHEAGYSCVITSGSDGEHSAKSLHYHGRALDFRTRHIPKHERPGIVDLIRGALGREYDVIFHATHIHVEWDPTFRVATSGGA